MILLARLHENRKVALVLEPCALYLRDLSRRQVFPLLSDDFHAERGDCGGLW